MGEPGLREDVIAALRAQPGVDVTVLNDGSVEIAAVGEPIRRFALRPTVPRGLLWRFVRWYKVPIAAFFPPIRTKPQTNAAGE